MANPGGSEQKFRIIIHSSSRVQRLAAGDSSVAVRAVLEGIIINGFYIKFKFFGRGRTRFPRCALPVCLARNWPLSTWFRWRSTLGQARAHCSCICIGKEYKINETLFCAVVASIIYSASFSLTAHVCRIALHNFRNPGDHTLNIWWHSLEWFQRSYNRGAHLHIMNNHFCSHFCGDEREGGVKWVALPAAVTGLLTRKSLLWFSGQGACWAGKVAEAADTRCWNGKFSM